ncbi:MAG TPA: carboxypeptidase-like regulatory domain-containing protein, partial [Vicinamibacterales bacterium]
MAQRAVLIALLTAALQAAQPRPATLQGHVVRAGSGTPVAHARVVVAKVGGALADYHTISTGADGRFTFANVSPGTYRVYATHDGYLQAELGRRGLAASGVPIILAEGQMSPDLEIAMTQTGVITGHVMLRGQPAANVWVRALKASYSDGERTLGTVDWAQTDDRGEYRLFGLTPGAYFVSATARARPWIEGDSIVVPTVATNANGNSHTKRSLLTLENVETAIFDPNMYPAVYHPGTLDPAAAQPIDVAPGATDTGIDFALTPSETFRVRGRVTIVDESGASRAINVDLQSAESSGALPHETARPDAAGSFEFSRVTPGRYLVRAQTADSGTPPLYDIARVDVVNQDPPGVTIALRRGVTVNGHVTVDGSAPASGGQPIFVQLQGARARGGSCCGIVRVQPDGSFAVDNVPARDYRLRVIQTGRSPWIKSARFGGTDVTRGPVQIGTDVKGRELEIDLGTRTGSIDALVVDSDQHPLSGVLVVALLAGDPSALRQGTTGSDGHARIAGVAPGDYTL